MIASLILFASQAMTFTADRIAADSLTRDVVATGHIVATSSPYTLRGESLTHAADGTFFFRDPTYATTCTNELGHTHWNVTGEIEYKSMDYVILRNMKLRFCEIPIMWMPYMYYPLGSSCGFSWMPGYTGRWGAYLLTRYSYDIYGSSTNGLSPWVRGGTRFDMRYEQGLALGQDLKWSLDRVGRGKFQFYYAWDRSDLADQYNIPKQYCDMDDKRYGFSAMHRIDPTERDSVWARGSYYSDCYFRQEFLRKAMLDNKRRFLAYDNSGVFWDHVENDFAFGAEVSGRLNEFYDMVGRLPEAYFDINPQPLFGLPVNFESENKVGYLRRDYADYGNLIKNSPYGYERNRWAEYETARFDTYNRLTAPMKFDDILSVVPRIGYHGTIWNRGGEANVTGLGDTGDAGNIYRSILEGGATFAARGTGMVNEFWQHVFEPYLDVLAQEAWLGGDSERPYVFDSIDASVMWEDQFAGRSRNLPYSYYGVTPGIRNAWERLDENGRVRNFFDLDVYSAVQFNDTSYIGSSRAHKLAKSGEPNYGDNGCLAVPGARVRWFPAKDLTFIARAECNTDDATIPVSDVGFEQKVNDDFRYHVRYVLRDYRIWDYSSVNAEHGSLDEDRNFAKINVIEVGFTQQPIDWFACSPYVRWDARDEKVDSVGTWVDFLTDCLGFRFSVEYEGAMTWYGGYKRDEDWSFGFYIYLRAFGADNAGLFE